MNFKNLKIGTRLSVLICLLSVLLVAVGLVGLYGISKSNASMESIYEDRSVPMGQIADIQKRLLRNRLAIATSVVNPAPEEVARNIAEVEANISAIGKVWDAYMATSLTPEEALLAKKFAEDRAQFVKDGLRPIRYTIPIQIGRASCRERVYVLV